jgi:hypothetical protein
MESEMFNTTKTVEAGGVLLQAQTPRGRRRLRGWGVALCVSLATTLGGTMLAPAAHAATPQYKVEALSFRAADESGTDKYCIPWVGCVDPSDEPYWIYSSVGSDGSATSRKSHVFGDVDTGETRTFSSSERCMFGNLSNGVCYGKSAPAGIGLSVQLWEEDDGDASANLAKTAEYFKKAGDLADYAPDPYKWVLTAAGYVGTACNIISGWLKDDLLGTRTLEYTASSLASLLPYAGRSFTTERGFGGLDSSNGADYYLTFRVTRVS